MSLLSFSYNLAFISLFYKVYTLFELLRLNQEYHHFYKRLVNTFYMQSKSINYERLINNWYRGLEEGTWFSIKLQREDVDQSCPVDAVKYKWDSNRWIIVSEHCLPTSSFINALGPTGILEFYYSLWFYCSFKSITICCS